MPYKSLAQARWGRTAEGIKALGGLNNVKEWEIHTDFSNLPDHVPSKKTKSSIMKKLIKNRNGKNTK